MLKAYYHLIKPGIIYGNWVTLIAGFFLGAAGMIHWHLLIGALVGLSFVIASGCVLNNYMDRDIDARMDRTKNRSLVTGEIPVSHAIIFAIVLIALGIFTLVAWTNRLTLNIAMIGAIIYVLLYTPMKKRSVYATWVGALAGAVPPIVGYTAATGKIDLAVVLLLLILVFWQMAHFYSIAIFRLEDYRSAQIPVFPVKYSLSATKINMLVFVICFIFFTALLATAHFAGLIYLIVALVAGLAWLTVDLRGFGKTVDTKKWARKMFFTSLIVLTTVSAAIIIDSLFRIRL